MEGLIPYVYKAIVQYRNGGQAPAGGSWFAESPSASYMRLPGDSGRFHAPEIQLFSSLSPPSPTSAKQPPLRRSTSRRRA